MKISTILFALILCLIGIASIAAQTSTQKPTPTPVPQTFDDIYGLKDTDLKPVAGGVNMWDIIKLQGLMEQRKYDDAIKILNDNLKASPTDAYLLSLRALAYYYKKDPAKALADAEASLKKDPARIRALNVRAMIERDRGQADAAQKDFVRSLNISATDIKSQSNPANDYYERGNTYLLMGENAKAAADFRKAIELSPTIEYAKEHLAIALSAQKALDDDDEKKFKVHADEFDRILPLLETAEAKAKKVEDALIADNKKNNRPQYSRNASDNAICSALAEYEALYDKASMESLAMSDMVESGPILDGSPLADVAEESAGAIVGTGGDILTRQLIWKCVEQKTSTTNAAQVTSSPEPTKPADVPVKPADNLASRTKAAIKKKEYDAVLAEINALISKNKKDAEALALRGDIYLAQSKTELARADYNQAIKLSPKTANYYYKRGMSYNENPGYNKQAVEADLAKTLELDPNNSGALTEKGFALNAAKNIPAAKAAFEAAVKSDPTNGPAYYQLGTIAIAENNAQAALDALTRSIAADPTYIYSFGSRAQVYEFLKQYDNAVADYDRIIELEPNREYGWGNRATFYYRLKYYDLAVEDYTKILTFTTTPDGYTRDRGAAYEAWGKYDEALADYDKYLNKNSWDKVMTARYNDLVTKTNAARATAKEMSVTFNAALEAYTPLEKELADKLDIFLALKKKNKTPNTLEKTGLCNEIKSLIALTDKVIAAFKPIQQLLDQGKLKGFSTQIDFAEDRSRKLQNTKNLLERDKKTFVCERVYFV
jgi:tetratricopeptide (TPR) repeat protein